MDVQCWQQKRDQKPPVRTWKELSFLFKRDSRVCVVRSRAACAIVAVELDSVRDTATLPLQSGTLLVPSGAPRMGLENLMERVIIPRRRTNYRIRRPRLKISSFVAKSTQGKSAI